MSRKKYIYRLFIWVTLIISIFILFSISSVLLQSDIIVVDDFAQFWAAGKVNFEGGNPYNPDEIKETIEDIGGRLTSGEVVAIMLNPPWTLALITPFAIFQYQVSRIMWLLVNIGFMITSIKFLWDIYEGEQGTRRKAFLLIVLFSPALAAIQKGQFTPILLLGIVIALYLLKTSSNSWYIGIFLALATIKPQLVYLFWIILIYWTVKTRKWRIILSMLTAVISLTFISFMINPAVINQYIQSLVSYPYSDWATPTIGSLLRIIFGIERFWLQFLPMIVTTIVYSWYWLRTHQSWDWLEDTPLLLATSMLTTAYAWTYDAIVFIIPIIQASIYIIKFSNLKTRSIIFSILLIISGLNLLLHTRLNDFWFIWLFPSLFLWYVISMYYCKSLAMEQNLEYTPD